MSERPVQLLSTTLSGVRVILYYYSVSVIEYKVICKDKVTKKVMVLTHSQAPHKCK